MFACERSLCLALQGDLAATATLRIATSTVAGAHNAHIGVATLPVVVRVDAASALIAGIDTTTLDGTTAATTTLGIAASVVLASADNDTIGALLFDGGHIAERTFHESDNGAVGNGIERGTWHQQGSLAGLLVHHALALDLDNAVGHHDGASLIPRDHHLGGLGCLQQRLAMHGRNGDCLAACHGLGQRLVIVLIIILFVVHVVVAEQHQLAIASQAEAALGGQLIDVIVGIVIVIIVGSLIDVVIIIVGVVVVLLMAMQRRIVEIIVIIIVGLLDNLEALHHGASIGASTWHGQEQIRVMLLLLQLLLLLAQLTLLQAWLCAEWERQREWVMATWGRQLQWVSLTWHSHGQGQEAAEHKQGAELGHSFRCSLYLFVMILSGQSLGSLLAICASYLIVSKVPENCTD